MDEFAGALGEKALGEVAGGELHAGGLEVPAGFQAVVGEDVPAFALGHNPLDRFMDEVGCGLVRDGGAGEFADLFDDEAEVEVFFEFEVEREPVLVGVEFVVAIGDAAEEFSELEVIVLPIHDEGSEWDEGGVFPDIDPGEGAEGIEVGDFWSGSSGGVGD